MLTIIFFIVSTFSIDPPLWPESFVQDYIVGDNKAQIYTTGRLFYDIKNNMQRNDFQNSIFDAFCSSISGGVNTPCKSINRDNYLYIWLPEKNQCCRCCSAENGCKITAKDWLKNFTYIGQADLNGESFYKWKQNFGGIQQNYYSTKNSERIPRRVDFGSFGFDFIINSYNKIKISPTIFNLPSYCHRDCPSSTICGTFSGNNNLSKFKNPFI